MQDTFFLTWIEHRRTRILCQKLSIPLAELLSPHRGVRRYAELTIRTLRTVFLLHPKVLIVQSPSIVLALLALALRPFLGYRLIVDAHNEAIEPYLHSSWAMCRLAWLLQKRADLTIVTNCQLAETVIRHGGRPLVLPDCIPVPPSTSPRNMPGEFRIVLISTFAGDEPFDAVIDAMRQIDTGVHLYVTGNPATLPATVKATLPSNITLTGFLSEHDYWAMLASSDAVMDLTTMDNCLVCGAYEAIAVQRPLVLSRNDASTELFADFAVFTDNTIGSIVNAIQSLRLRHRQLVAGMPKATIQFNEQWQRRAQELHAFIDQAT